MKQTIFAISFCLMWILFCIDSPALVIFGIFQCAIIGIITDFGESSKTITEKGE